MKKLAFLLAVCAIFVSSCKKDYTCTCVGGLKAGSYIIPSATQQEAATICVGLEAYAQGATQTSTCSL